jgi:hypothetical protein
MLREKVQFACSDHRCHRQNGIDAVRPLQVRMLKRLITNRAVRLALRSVQTAVYGASRTIYRELRFSSNLAGAAHGQCCQLVNVGCGDLTKDGWINLDAASPSGGRYYYNAVNPLPFGSGSIEHIHAEHFLEHLDYFDACRFIREYFRVLRPGGHLESLYPIWKNTSCLPRA